MNDESNLYGSVNSSKAPEKRRRIITALAGLVIVLLIAAILLNRQGNDEAATSSKSAQGTTATVPAKDVVKAYPQGEVVDGVKRFHVTVNDRKVTDGPSTINVKQNDKVMIEFVTDRDVENEVKLEGHDASTSIDKGSVGQMSFTADKVGTFKIVSVRIGNTDGSRNTESVTMGQVVVTN